MKSKFVSLTAIIPILILLSSCGQAPTEPVVTEVDYNAEANRLAQEILLIDTHIDLPYRLIEKMEDVTVRTEGGQFDYVRAQEGGLDAAFMSIYIPASLQEEGGARELGDELIDLVEGLEEQSPEKFAIARSVADVRANFERGFFSLPMGIENGAAIEDDLANLQHFYDRGVRYMTLTHSEPNLICDSSYAEERVWNGLSPFGREVVAEMNRLGIMVDISHVTDETFYQVIEITKAPVIASHSCARHFTPGFERNMSDEMITVLAENGGVIQIAFGPMFLSGEAQKQSMKLWAEMRQFMEENKVRRDSPEFRERLAQFYEENPKVTTSVVDAADQIDYIIDLVGVDHVGLGSDFDGTVITTFDTSELAALTQAMLDAGLTEAQIRKVAGQNMLRVLRARLD